MAKISGSQLDQLFRLSELNLDKKEKEDIKIKLSKVLTYIEKLEEVDTSNTSETSQITGIVNVFREDKRVSRNKNIKNKNSFSGKYYIAPAVFG